MMSRIDPIRRATYLRRAARPDGDEPDGAQDVGGANLPVPVDAPRAAPPRPPRTGSRAGPGAEFAAQLLGQDGQKRGLRAGAELMGSAKTTYVRTEWSGERDRRARKGRITKTDV